MSLQLKNRGKESDDNKIFSSKWLPILREAVIDMSHLLSRGYGERSSLQLVGNRYKLNSRQRKAVFRVSSSNTDVSVRQAKCFTKEQIQNRVIDIDGFNILILLESALSGAFIFKSKDGTYRDISSVHGSYRRVIKTEEAINLIGNVLFNLDILEVNWFLDAPVSNSGKLKKRLEVIGIQNNYNWNIYLVNNPDRLLVDRNNIVVSSDGWILDRCYKWFNLPSIIFSNLVTTVNVLDFY